MGDPSRVQGALHTPCPHRPTSKQRGSAFAAAHDRMAHDRMALQRRHRRQAACCHCCCFRFGVATGRIHRASTLMHILACISVALYFLGFLPGLTAALQMPPARKPPPPQNLPRQPPPQNLPRQPPQPHPPTRQPPPGRPTPRHPPPSPPPSRQPQPRQPPLAPPRQPPPSPGKLPPSKSPKSPPPPPRSPPPSRRPPPPQTSRKPPPPNGGSFAPPAPLPAPPAPPPLPSAPDRPGGRSLGLRSGGPAVRGRPLKNRLFKYLTVGLALNRSTFVATWNLDTDVDWRSSMKSGVSNQDKNNYCSACWAFAAADAIEGAVAAAGWKNVKPLSVQQLVDCSRGSCEDGGYSSDAFEYVAGNSSLTTNASYPYVGLKDDEVCGLNSTNMVDPIKIVRYEEVSVSGALALMLAVQHQPVTVQLEADQDSFLNYNGTYIYANDSCFAYGMVNHEVLVVGYHLENKDRVEDPRNYFILKNSWGTSWGNKGYMYIGMQKGPYGYCGIGSSGSFYPVLPVIKGLGDPCATKPCGGGKCSASTDPMAPWSYTCDCSTQWFLVATKNDDGSPTCTSRIACALKSQNPCGWGACVDNGDGDYHCICPRYFDQGKRYGGNTACVPGSNVSTSYLTQPGDDCYTIALTKALTTSQLESQNPALDCKRVEEKLALNVTSDVSFNCSLYYTVDIDDSCEKITERFDLSTSLLKFLNPGLECKRLAKGQQICVQNGTLPAASNTTTCAEYYTVGSSGNDSCTALQQKYSLSAADFFSINEGLFCSKLSAGDTVCVQKASSSGNGATVCQKSYYVTLTDTCATLVSSYFKGNSKWVPKLNSGFVCLNSKLYVGLKLCVCWW